MKYYQIILFYFLSTNFCLAQEDTKQFEINCPIAYINTQPEFPGGIERLSLFFKSKLNSKKYQNKSFPVGFTIFKDGKVGGIKVLDKRLKVSKRQIKNFIEEMPKWKPAISNGKTIQSEIVLTINL